MISMQFWASSSQIILQQLNKTFSIRAESIPRQLVSEKVKFGGYLLIELCESFVPRTGRTKLERSFDKEWT